MSLVSVERADDHVAWLTISEAAALDRRDVAMGAELCDALLTTADDDDVKVIVLSGLESAADAGAVVSPSVADRAGRGHYAGVRGLHQIVTYCKKVVIVAVDGPCGPTASALCLGADFVVASEHASFASPFSVAEANYPLAVLTMRANRTKAWMLRGGTLDAAAALGADFVNEVVERSALHPATTALARRIAVMPLDGITVSKMNVGAAFDVVGVGREFDAVEAAVSSGGVAW